MSGGGGKTISSESPRLSTIRLNQSAYGSAVPWVRGTNRLAGNLIWYSDFTAIPHTSTEEMGGKGGGGGGMKSTTYTYTCALAISLCEGEIVDIGQVWSSKDKTTLADLGFTLFKGTLPQTAWSYLTTAHPTEALGYPGIAYIANGKLNLGDSADLPNLSFEVKGPRTIGEIVVGTPMLDARPDEILTDLLTDPLSGAGFDGNLIHGLTSYRTYCQAAGFFVSPAISEQSTANDHVKALMAMTNSETVWSEDKLKVVPYGDSPVTGNGVTWTPDVTPLFDLTDDDFLADAGDDIIRINRKRPADAYNRVQIEFNNRALEYNTDIGEAKDGANIAQFGLRPKDPVQMHWITRREMADQVADLIMRRELYILNEYEFKLGWRYGMLEAMDIVTLTHASLGLNHAVVRIISADESPDGDIDIVAEEMPWSNATPAKVVTQSGSGAAVDYNIAPGNSNAPVLFEPPISLAGAPELWLATSGGANWGGCEVWVSMDDATYTRIGNVTAPARHGVLTATMASGSDPDVSTTVAVDLGVSRGTLAGGTLEERDLLTTLSWVDGEFISFQNAALTGSYRYDLTSLRRGVSGSAVAMHSVGAKFTRIDGAIFKYAYDASMLSKTIYVKLRSFNVYGSGLQDLASLTPVTYVIAGAPVGIVMGLAAEQPFTGRSARIKWDVMAGAIAYRVEVWAASILRRSIEISETRFEYSFEDSTADGGPWRNIEFHIYSITKSGVSSTAAVLPLNNPQVSSPSAVAVTPLLEGLSVRCTLPLDTDYSGCQVWASTTSGFDPAATLPVYDGPDTNFAWYGLAAGTDYYVRIGCYDVFGKDGMSLSSEVLVTVRGIVADPAATLSEINTLLTDGSGSAVIKMIADRFSIQAPDGIKIPFAVVDTGGGVYKTLLNSDVLIGGNVDIANLTTGSLPSDVIMRLGGGIVQLDGMGEIRVYSGLGVNQDFVKLSSAQINFMRYISGIGYVTYNYLSRLETGIANSGDTVVIPGYWKVQPRVMVSLASLALYKAAYAAQDQGITTVANALIETSPGSSRWQFSPTATLNLSASSGVTPVNEASGSLSSNSWASATKTTAANCASVTPTVSFSSSRGNGVGQYFRRYVRWRVEYWNGSAWVPGAWRNVNMGDQFGAVGDSVAYGFPYAGSWSWRIYAEAYDTDGSVFGSVSYTTSIETITGQTGQMVPSGNVVTVTRPASTLNTTWEIYKLEINIAGSMNNPYTQYGSNSMTFSNNRPTGAPAVTNAGMTVSGWSDNKTVSYVPNYSNNPFSMAAVFTKITTALVPNTTVGTATVVGDGIWTPSWTCMITTNTMVVHRRTPNTNSTTPANTFNVASYGWSLASAQVLATGSINWIAVGE